VGIKPVKRRLNIERGQSSTTPRGDGAHETPLEQRAGTELRCRLGTKPTKRRLNIERGQSSTTPRGDKARETPLEHRAWGQNLRHRVEMEPVEHCLNTERGDRACETPLEQRAGTELETPLGDRAAGTELKTPRGDGACEAPLEHRAGTELDDTAWGQSP
jgi:hypothetical protein